MLFRGIVAFSLLGGAFGVALWSTGATSRSDNPTDSPPLTTAAIKAQSIVQKTAAAPLRPIAPPERQQAVSGTVIEASLLDPAPLVIRREIAREQPAHTRGLQLQAKAAQPKPAPTMPAELLTQQDLPPQALALADPDARIPAAKPLPPGQGKRAAEKLDVNNLSAVQIARIKATLNITPDQEEYWQPVEAALLDIAKQQAARRAAGRKGYAIAATDSQQLYWTAGPLIMRLREDQKREARNLARSLGLTTVASLI